MKNIKIAKRVLSIEAQALLDSAERIGENFSRAVEILMATSGQIILTGMGKSGIIGRKIAATLTSTGSSAVFLHPAEATHGDLGIIHHNDTVIALSTSGETEEVVRLIAFIKRIGAQLIALTGNPQSTLAKESDVFLDCSIKQEACPIGLVPTASTTLTLAMGDALAIALMESKGFSADDFLFFHPGGSIGKKLLKVKHLMHTDEKKLPIGFEETPMRQVIEIINEKKFGLIIIIDRQFKVKGIITDGDLRRALLKNTNFLENKASDWMTKTPKTITPDSLAVEALKKMEENAITALVVASQDNKLLGLVHLHDLWRTEMI